HVTAKVQVGLKPTAFKDIERMCLGTCSPLKAENMKSRLLKSYNEIIGSDKALTEMVTEKTMTQLMREVEAICKAHNQKIAGDRSSYKQEDLTDYLVQEILGGDT